MIASLEKGADINAKDEGDGTALYEVSNRYEKVVRLLLEKGADIDVRNHWEGTALYIAASQGYIEVVRLVLQKGQTSI